MAKSPIDEPLLYADVTGRLYSLLPEGPERDELLGFARLGVDMKRQHVGKRPEFLQQYIQELVDQEVKKPSFAELLIILEAEAYRRDRQNDHSPIEKVDRTWEILTYHDDHKRRRQVAFETVRNKLSRCNK